MAYFPLSIALLLVFMTVNALLILPAYVKTTVHKFLLLRRYRNPIQRRNLVTYVFFGLPILVLSQFTDAVRFLVLTYRGKNLKLKNGQTDGSSSKTLQSELSSFLQTVAAKLDSGMTEENAFAFISSLSE